MLSTKEKLHIGILTLSNLHRSSSSDNLKMIATYLIQNYSVIIIQNKAILDGLIHGFVVNCLLANKRKACFESMLPCKVYRKFPTPLLSPTIFNPLYRDILY